MQKLKAVSLYSGADNLGDGLFQAGHEVIMAVEYYPKNPSFSKDACATIKENHPDTEVICKPVSEILSTLPKCDILIGGPPCPEFSRANTDRTFDLCEVNNFNKAREITGAKHHIMENVQDLNKVYKEKNYLINCADYGVPQTRIRRIFTNLELPEPSHAEYPSQRLFGGSTKKWVSVKNALDLSDGFIEEGSIRFGEDKKRIYDINKPSHTVIISTDDKFTPEKTLRDKNPEWFDKHKPNQLNNPAYTVTCSGDDIVSDGNLTRRLTNPELAILQGFRKDFKFVGSKTSIKRMIGNAVPSQISKAFMEYNFNT
jgi:DNA (cytosine-5)-methyltransferase 1